MGIPGGGRRGSSKEKRLIRALHHQLYWEAIKYCQRLGTGNAPNKSWPSEAAMSTSFATDSILWTLLMDQSNVPPNVPSNVPCNVLWNILSCQPLTFSSLSLIGMRMRRLKVTPLCRAMISFESRKGLNRMFYDRRIFWLRKSSISLHFVRIRDAPTFDCFAKKCITNRFQLSICSTKLVWHFSRKNFEHFNTKMPSGNQASSLNTSILWFGWSWVSWSFWETHAHSIGVEVSISFFGSNGSATSFR